MNSYEIINEYDEESYEILNKVLDKTLEKEDVTNAIFSVILIDNERMQKLNKEYRNIDYGTDVLSFAYEDNESEKLPYRMLGEIFINIDRMKMQAKEYGHSETREIAFLAVHGLLHLLGFDHTKSKEDERVMFALQREVLNEFEETRKA